jgi:hypothetical protein
MVDAKICKVDDCCNKAVARNLCTKHWSRWRRHGDPNVVTTEKLPEKCAVPDCERKPHSRWKRGEAFCNMHWQRLYLTGTLEEKVVELKQWAFCSTAGCNNHARTSGGSLCEKHYIRLRRTGNASLKIRNGRKSFHSAGYIVLKAPNHPLAQKGGGIYEHRMILFDALGDGAHCCYWCSKEIFWKGDGRSLIVVDHLDGNKANNELNNLVPSCHRCNSTRGLFQAWVMRHKNDPFLKRMFDEALLRD